MAHIYRLIVFLLSMVWAVPSFSAVPKATQYSVSYEQHRIWRPSREAACNEFVQWKYGAGYRGVVDGTWCAVFSGASYIQNFPTVIKEGCETGYTEEGEQCIPPQEPKTADQLCEDLAALYNSWNWTSHRDAKVDTTKNLPLSEPSLVCMANSSLLQGSGINASDYPPGCMHSFTPTMRGKMDENSPQYRYWGDTWMVGTWNSGQKACVPGLDGQVPDPPEVPAGEPQGPCRGFEGSFNGVDVCIDPSSGRTEGVDWTRVTDADGNVKEQTTTVTCDGEKCTVKTNTKTPGDPGEGTTTTTTTSRGAYCAKNPESAVCKGDKDPTGSTRNRNGRGGAGDPAGTGNGGGNGEGNGFCKENPESPICKQGSFSGSCAASFACDGDAIQCAIAKEQHLRNCKMFDDPSPESQLYEANKGKEGNQTGELPGNETVDIAGRIDMSNALGAGSCVSDRTVTVWGQSVVLPFSAICPSLAMFGQLLVAVSLLLAARIVLRG